VGTRIKVVWPGSGPGARLQKFYVVSAVSHAALAVAFIFLPGLFPDSRPNFTDDFLDNAIFAELVSGIDQPASPPAQAAPVVEKAPEPVAEPPQPEPEPEETTAAGDVEYNKRAEPTPAKEDPKPAPPTDTAPSESGETSGDIDTGERVGDAGAGVSGGGEISLFGWYQSSVSRALYSTWQRPLLAGLREPLSVVISFNIQKDGSIANLRVVETSGVSALDRSALRAVADASPLPRLPPAWRGPSMTAAYLFEITPEDF